MQGASNRKKFHNDRPTVDWRVINIALRTFCQSRCSEWKLWNTPGSLYRTDILEEWIRFCYLLCRFPHISYCRKSGVHIRVYTPCASRTKVHLLGLFEREVKFEFLTKAHVVFFFGIIMVFEKWKNKKDIIKRVCRRKVYIITGIPECAPIGRDVPPSRRCYVITQTETIYGGAQMFGRVVCRLAVSIPITLVGGRLVKFRVI